jgi:hypothetical protein
MARLPIRKQKSSAICNSCTLIVHSMHIALSGNNSIHMFNILFLLNLNRITTNGTVFVNYGNQRERLIKTIIGGSYETV